MWTHCCFWSFHRICWQSDQTAPHINTAMVEAWVEYSVCWLTWLRPSPTYNLYHFPAVKAHDSYNPTHSINSITHLLHIDLVGWSLWSDTPTHTHTLRDTWSPNKHPVWWPKSLHWPWTISGHLHKETHTHAHTHFCTPFHECVI